MISDTTRTRPLQRPPAPHGAFADEEAHNLRRVLVTCSRNVAVESIAQVISSLKPKP